jgi:ribosome-associated protein
MISIAPGLSIDEREIEERFIRASGPGGQNVNKVSSAVQLRFDAGHSPNLSASMRTRLARLAGRRLNQDGILIITAQRHRTQARNRDDAMGRLVALLRAAAMPPPVRRPTRPTAASRQRRLATKQRRASIKRLRGPPPGDE